MPFLPFIVLLPDSTRRGHCVQRGAVVVLLRLSFDSCFMCSWMIFGHAESCLFICSFHNIMSYRTWLLDDRMIRREAGPGEAASVLCLCFQLGNYLHLYETIGLSILTWDVDISEPRPLYIINVLMIYSEIWSPVVAFACCTVWWIARFETSVSHYVEYCAWQGDGKTPANVKSAVQCLLGIPYIVSPVILLVSQR